MSWPSTLHRPVPAMRVHLPLDRVDVGDRREVEVFSPDERRELADEGLARRDIAGDGARLDQGGALPVLPHALVVEQRRRGGERDARRGGIGPQPQVDAEDVAVGRALLQQRDDAGG